jgi:hypothetical protein
MGKIGERTRWPRSRRALLLVGLAVTLGLVLAACSAPGPGAKAGNPSSAAPTSTATRTNEAGSVTLKVTWPGPSAGLSFAVAMDTHSVDLDGVDLGQSAVLRNDRGIEVKPSAWEVPKGGHHRSGTLTFPDKGPDGVPVIGPDTRAVELVIRNVAGVPERTLRWDLQG